jgi:hypothetical protein
MVVWKRMGSVYLTIGFCTWMPRLSTAGLKVGLHLFNSMAGRMRAALSLLQAEGTLPMLSGGPVPEGSHFVYESAPSLFSRRSGSGPLFIAWDTSLLVDYFKFGKALWEGGELPDVPDHNYRSELEGLQLLIALWILRDIRFVILPQSINDAKRSSPQSGAPADLGAFDGFASALRLVSSGSPSIDLPSRDGLLILPDSLLEHAVARCHVASIRYSSKPRREKVSMYS